MPIRIFLIILTIASISACGSPSTSPAPAIVTPPPVTLVDPCISSPPTGDIATYHCSWAHKALSYQRELGHSLPLREAQILSSHNSANSVVYTGASTNDFNQTRTIEEQFQLDMRSVEFDVHWLAHSSGGHAPVLCHGLPASQEHLGCTAGDRHLQEGLDEIVAFLASAEGQNQVVVFDIEDHLTPSTLAGGGTTTEQAHDAALAIITATLGDEIYLPPQDGSCHNVPMDISLDDIIAAGKRVLLTAGCGTGDWPLWSFGIGIRHQKANDGYDAYPDCESSNFSFANYRENWVRLWEDTTQVGATTNGSLQRMDQTTLRHMAHCGVNFSSLDRVDPNPPAVSTGNPAFAGQGVEFEDLVWSWASDLPAFNSILECAYLDGADGRFKTADCSETRQYACLSDTALDAPITDASTVWLISSENGESSASDACNSHAGYHYAVPRSGWLKQQLVEAMNTATVSEIWLNYRETDHHIWQ